MTTGPVIMTFEKINILEYAFGEGGEGEGEGVNKKSTLCTLS